MTEEPVSQDGLLVIREGQYALALLPTPFAVHGVHIERRLQIQGDLLCSPLIPILDMMLLAHGVHSPGLTIAGVAT